MKRDPILAVRNFARGSKYFHNRVPLTVRVEGGLEYIRGNDKPYFTLTLDIHRKGFPNQCQSGGCDHETILKYWPKFKDLAILHLSDIEGRPMHGPANAWYDLAGCLPDNAGQQFHVGNSQRHFPKPANAPRKHAYDDTDYRVPTPEECLELFANHVRVPLGIARLVRQFVIEKALAGIEDRKALERSGFACLGIHSPMPPYDWANARTWFNAWIESQSFRWLQEANACIAKHNLRVFGDTWPPEVKTEVA
jgi:hypothetical protein